MALPSRTNGPEQDDRVPRLVTLPATRNLQLAVKVREHRFGPLVVLKDIDFVVKAGEVVAVIGPSGCGKSTLLSIVGGLLEASEGGVYYSGDLPVGCLNPFTYVFQDFALLPWLTVRENVAYPLGHHRLERAELDRRVRNALQRTGLEDFANSFPKQLSGGMRQRVGIARALAVSPAVLLMDEPLSALDAQTRDILMQDFLDLLVVDRITGIYVTHNLDEAIRLANRIVVLSRRPGKIKEIVTVPVPQVERDRLEHAVLLAELREHLWSLIRDEAIIANREGSDVQH